MAIDSMRKAYARDEVRELIEAREKAERDEVSRLHQARQEGVQEGKEEAARTIARRLRESGVSAEQVAEATGLTEQEISQL